MGEYKRYRAKFLLTFFDNEREQRRKFKTLKEALEFVEKIKKMDNYLSSVIVEETIVERVILKDESLK